MCILTMQSGNLAEEGAFIGYIPVVPVCCKGQYIQTSLIPTSAQEMLIYQWA